MPVRQFAAVAGFPSGMRAKEAPPHRRPTPMRRLPFRRAGRMPRLDAASKGRGSTTFGLHEALQNQSCEDVHPRQKAIKAMTPAIVRPAMRSLPGACQSLPARVATLVLSLSSVQLDTGEAAASACGQPVQAFESKVLQAWAHSLAF